jgi:signal transduction histidine kinase
VIGFLGLEVQDEERIFNPEEITLLDIFSFDIARLIEDSHLFEQTKALITQEERGRLARDLHDSVTQVLFSATLMADVLPRIWQRDPDRGMQGLEKLRLQTRGALAEMRTMLLELRPAAVINTPLGELLAQLTEAITSRSGLLFLLYIEQIPPLQDDVQTSFYRIAQESLNNIVKHAQAKQVTISLSATPLTPNSIGEMRHETKLEIKDDGVGFASGAVLSDRLGIGIMKERAESIHADFSLESKPGYGTRVTVICRTKSRDQQ